MEKETLKAYGNAIVPQVMYEIFLMIDEIEKMKKIYDINSTNHFKYQFEMICFVLKTFYFCKKITLI